MRTRVITAVVAIVCIFPFFWFSDPVGLQNPLNYLFPLLMVGISVVSAFEMLRCVGLWHTWALSVPLTAAAAVFPMLARVMTDQRAAYIKAALMTALVLALYAFGVMVFRFGRIDLSHIALAFTAIFYTTAGYSAIVILRDEGRVGRFLFLIPFVFAWVTDTFAYFSGRLFGKHKLIPAVSPKKTVEGAVGGLLFGAVTAVVYGLIATKVDPAVHANYWVLSFGGIAIALVSQIGDLLMSAIKRQFGLKDFGKFLPGHGGLLDRFDSTLAVTVLLVVLNTYFPIFTV